MWVKHSSQDVSGGAARRTEPLLKEGENDDGPGAGGNRESTKRNSHALRVAIRVVGTTDCGELQVR